MRTYNPSKYEIICGVYVICNIINNKRYVGKADNIYHRWDEHTNDLNKNKHFNKHLQRAWSKYGSENFKFSILEACDTSEEAYEREKYWVKYYDAYHNGYNQNEGGKGGFNYKHTEETKKKMSEIKLAQMQDSEYIDKLISSHESRPVVQVNLITKEITEWSSATAASKFLHLSSAHAILSALESNSHLSHDSLWFDKDDYIEFDYDPIEFIANFPRYYVKYVGIHQYNFKGELIKVWHYDDFIRDKKLRKSYIYKCCKFEKDSYLDSIWLYEKDAEKIDDLIPNFKKQSEFCCEPINVYDINENFIIEYKNAKEAMHELNIPQVSCIIECCYDERKTMYNYIFKFKNMESLYTNGRNVAKEKIKKQYDNIKKEVYQFDKNFNLIRKWGSLTEIENELGLNQKYIIDCCKLRQQYYYDSIWRYVKNFDLNLKQYTE